MSFGTEFHRSFDKYVANSWGETVLFLGTFAALAKTGYAAAVLVHQDLMTDQQLEMSDALGVMGYGAASVALSAMALIARHHHSNSHHIPPPPPAGPIQ